MSFIQQYIRNRQLKKFMKEEELRIEKERIRIESDLQIEKIKEYNAKKQKQEKCNHNYVQVNKNYRVIKHSFNLTNGYYEFDLICTKCHKEQKNVDEEDRNYLLNKSKVINGKTLDNNLK